MLAYNNYFHHQIAFHFIQKILYNNLCLIHLPMTEYITSVFSKELFHILSKSNYRSTISNHLWERSVLLPFYTDHVYEIIYQKDNIDYKLSLIEIINRKTSLTFIIERYNNFNIKIERTVQRFNYLNDNIYF